MVTVVPGLKRVPSGKFCVTNRALSGATETGAGDVVVMPAPGFIAGKVAAGAVPRVPVTTGAAVGPGVSEGMGGAVGAGVSLGAGVALGSLV
jgi:hypothetical protein